MKTFISTIALLFFSFLVTEPRTSSQDINIEYPKIETYSQAETLSKELLHRAKLTYCEVLILSNQMIIDGYIKPEDITPRPTGWEDILREIDSLDNEVNTKKEN